jgi:predicted nucleic acid-binding protein
VSPKFLDTLFIVALINQRDQHHATATRLALELAGRPLLTTDGVLLEIGNALAKDFKLEAVTVLEELLASEELQIVSLTPELFEAAFHLYKTHLDKEWGMVDCASFVVMRTMGVQEALTFDRHFEQAGFTALMRSE